MMIIAGTSHPELADDISQLLKIPCIHAIVNWFEDQELRIQIPAHLHGEDVIVVQSTSKPANDHLMELLLIIDTARRAGAKTITTIIPYFGYSRQDRPSYEYGPISASLVANLLEAAGINRIITLDLHSRQIEGFFKAGVHNISPLTLFAPLFPEKDSYAIVSPDVGGLVRAQNFSSLLGVGLAVINKVREQNGVCKMSKVIGSVKGKHCILVDDIVDTAGTLCLAAELLLARGATAVTACVTHGVLSGEAIEKIEKSAINRIYITNSIKHSKLPDKFEILPIASLLAETLSTKK